MTDFDDDFSDYSAIHDDYDNFSMGSNLSDKSVDEELKNVKRKSDDEDDDDDDEEDDDDLDKLDDEAEDENDDIEENDDELSIIFEEEIELIEEEKENEEEEEEEEDQFQSKKDDDDDDDDADDDIKYIDNVDIDEEEENDEEDVSVSNFSTFYDNKNHVNEKESTKVIKKKIKRVKISDKKCNTTNNMKIDFKACFTDAQKALLKKDHFKFGSLPPSYNYMKKKMEKSNSYPLKYSGTKCPITKYEFTRMVGFRLVQFSKGLISFAYWDDNVEEPSLMDQIRLEIEQELSPLVLAHLNPDKTITYRSVNDYDFSNVYFEESEK